MKKVPFLTALFIIMPLTLSAGYSVRGYKAYNKLCMECHGKPFKGASMLAQFEWRGMFDDKDRELIAVHKNNEKAMERLDSSYYQKKRKHLKKFLINNANDTGKAPTCNADVCGDM